MDEFFKDPHYLAVQEFYGDRCAERSGVLYIQHINEGLVVLDAINATTPARRAYCLHPLVQGNTELESAFQDNSVLFQYPINVHAMALAIEYRWTANNYLSWRDIASIDEIQFSPLPDVQQMLIADKVQNRKDFELYHRMTHPRAKDLEQYFQNWLSALGVSEARYEKLVKQINLAYPSSRTI